MSSSVCMTICCVGIYMMIALSDIVALLNPDVTIYVITGSVFCLDELITVTMVIMVIMVITVTMVIMD